MPTLSLALAGLLVLPAASQAQLIIGINPADTRVFMAPTDLAGANSSVRVGNWNNYSSSSATLLGDDLVYHNGNTIGGSFQVVAFSSRGFSAADTDPPSENDRRFFLGRPDLRGGESTTWTITGIPFAQYDLYIYARGTASDRGGSIAVDGQTTHFVRNGNPANSDGTGYTQITSTVYDPLDPGSGVSAGNYVFYEGLSGSSRTITLETLDMGNASVQRFHSVGFQIVQIPEPTTAAALVSLLAFALVAVRRVSGRVRR